MTDEFTFTDEGDGVANWSSERTHVSTAEGVLTAEQFDLDRETWDEISISEIDDICDGRTTFSDPTLVRMVRAANAYIIEWEAEQ